MSPEIQAALEWYQKHCNICLEDVIPTNSDYEISNIGSGLRKSYE